MTDYEKEDGRGKVNLLVLYMSQYTPLQIKQKLRLHV
jgi:hypothetical protein